MKNNKSLEFIAMTGMMLLPIATSWLFLPNLANSFEIKHYIATMGALILVLLGIIRLDIFALPRGIIGSGLIVFVLAALGSSVCAGNPYLAIPSLLEATAFILLVLALFNFNDAATVQRQLESGIIIAGSGVAFFALKQFLFPDMFDPGFSALGKMKIYSTLGNPNLAALIILASIPSTAWRTLRGSVFLRYVYAALTLLLVVGLLLTQARHALVAICVTSVVALLWLGSKVVRRNVLVGLMIASFVCVAVILFVDLPPSVVHSIKGRSFIWLTALKMLWENLVVGVGLGHFGINHLSYQSALFTSGHFDAYFDNAAVISEGHNDFLNWGAMSGIFGLLGFTALCVGTLWKGWHSPALKQHAPQLYLALVGYIVAMFFISVTSYTAPALFFWLLLSMIWARSKLSVLEWKPHTGVRITFAICLVGLLIVTGHQAWRDLRGNSLEAQGDKLIEQHDLWLADQAYQDALQWNPRNSTLHIKYATSLFLAGDLQQALAELEQAKRGSGDLGIYMLEGEIRTKLGDLSHAVAVYRQIIASFPNMVGPHFILGQVYQLQGKRNDAKIEFRKVLDIKPSPFNLNMTVEKVELQKRIVRDYLNEYMDNPAQAVEVPGNTEIQD